MRPSCCEGTIASSQANPAIERSENAVLPIPSGQTLLPDRSISNSFVADKPTNVTGGSQNPQADKSHQTVCPALPTAQCLRSNEFAPEQSRRGDRQQRQRQPAMHGDG